ncbi:transposase [Purpureocillium lavendulum]|uniref:Fructose-1,6-bisphosphatase n=1 Tax=Purpureocillium lavendulum TaxID=1247861 RepID=A0AB34FG03_9HYPO|nr:fructose-1,6-bisphosphatase [Purpureocillium lavendulum]KAJ6438007.1 hypothetical protein O9K51_09429 [Purpureocillium lavendulum]KAJ6438046.1 transposase [Purpureocillium lavendulum]
MPLSAAWPSHKGGCVRPNYIIEFHLAPAQIANPPVTRILSCPAQAVFYMLHLALQTAFGWATTHSFDFAVVDPDYREPEDIMEIISRRTAMGPTGDQLPPASAPRAYLFRVVDPVKQTLFSGIDRMHEPMRRHPNTPEKRADNYKLYELFDDERFRSLYNGKLGRQIVYTYDFGDNWEHHLRILGRADPTTDFICLDGSGHYVAEDSGGAGGWEDVKAAYRNQSPTKEQMQRRHWFERQASNLDPRGLAGDRAHAWDRAKINRELETDTMFERFQKMGDTSDAYRDRASAELRSG